MQEVSHVGWLREKLKAMDANYNRDRDALLRTIEILEAETPKTPTWREVLERDIPPAVHDASHTIPVVDRFFRQYGGVKKAVVKSISLCEGNFSIKDIEAKLKDIAPKVAQRVNGTLSSMLWKFNKEGKIVLVTKGTGRQPSIYRKP